MTTTPCPSCRTPATPGMYCIACGTPVPAPTAPASAPPAAPRGSRRWLPVAAAGAVIVAVAVIAAVILVVVGGEPAQSAKALSQQRAAPTVDAVRLSAQNLYAPVENGRLTALVPAGWSRGRPEIGDVAQGLTAESAQDAGATVTVGVLAGSAASLADRARRLRRARRRLPGYEEVSFRRVRLAGERPAFTLTYRRHGATTVEYVTAACDEHLLVSGTAPDTIFRTLAPRFGVVARSFQPIC